MFMNIRGFVSDVCYSLRLTLSGAKAQLAVHICQGSFDMLAAVHPRHLSRRTPMRDHFDLRVATGDCDGVGAKSAE